MERPGKSPDSCPGCYAGEVAVGEAEVVDVVTFEMG